MSFSKLTKDEEKLIEKYLSHYLSIELGDDRGVDSPNYSKEKRIHFREVCREEKEPETEHEIAYLKYKKLTQLSQNVKTSNSSTNPSDNSLVDQSNRPMWDWGEKEPPRRGNIPEVEGGFPRSEFGSRDDFKKDSTANWRDSKKNRSSE